MVVDPELCAPHAPLTKVELYRLMLQPPSANTPQVPDEADTPAKAEAKATRATRRRDTRMIGEEGERRRWRGAAGNSEAEKA